MPTPGTVNHPPSQIDVSSNSSKLVHSLGIPTDATLFLYIGRSSPVRGFDLLEEAAARILATNENAFFLIAGLATRSPSMEKRWIEVGLTETPGELIAACDCMVLPNRFSLFDLIMIEALGCGIPLIVSATGGMNYLLNKSDGVRFFRTGDLAELIAELHWFLKSDQNARKRMGESNRSLYLQAHTVERFAASYESFLNDIYDDFDLQL
jgi:glycosyltransferase involved in cell wall biosynthesis